MSFKTTLRIRAQVSGQRAMETCQFEYIYLLIFILLSLTDHFYCPDMQ